MKVISKKHTYTGADGEEKVGYNYYLVLDNGSRLAIKPSFSRDYQKLFFICEREE